MRIALVCPYAWEDAGGVQVQVRGLGEQLRSRGHQVLVLTPSRSSPAEPWVASVGHPLDVPYNGSNAPVSPWPATRRRVRAALAAFGPDVVHAHEPLAPSASMFATLAARVPVVGTFHAGLDRARAYDLAAPLLRLVARRLTVRVAVSERAAATAQRRLGGTYEIVPNGIDVRAFSTAEARSDLGPGRKLLFVGRLQRRKGFRTAIEAFAELAPTHPDLRLVVAGEGHERSAAASLPAAVRARVIMLGTVGNRELPPVHHACDLFVAPNHGGESFGVVLLEAMAAGLPVVASDIPGYDEVVTDGQDGLLVAPGDAAALAGAVSRVLGDDSLASRLAEAGRRRTAAFGWETVTPRLEELYTRAAAEPRRSLP
ncbi:MAG: glycosyltransferase family 4 protein [Actinomycetota bacterium]